ncbi:Gamma carbonic anhydrase-like 1 [Picochlorum sp. SENEW3]|nr:Gamma carbonic anhydrase-like 1 [Picochlorum sp. SENEW3]
MLGRRIASQLLQETGKIRHGLSVLSLSQQQGFVHSSALLAEEEQTKTSSDQPPVKTIHIEDEVYNRQRNILNLGNRVVKTIPSSWIAPSAVVVGDVDVYENVSIWHNCVVRGDLNSIRIGAFSNIQDRTVIHAASTAPTGLPAATVIGQRVSIGQGCLIRSATIGDACVVGDRSILLEGSRMESQSVLEPGSVLPPGRLVPSGQVWAGRPAKFVRKLSKDEKAAIPEMAEDVCTVVDEYASEFLPQSGAYREAEELRSALDPSSAIVRGADVQGISDDALGKFQG